MVRVGVRVRVRVRVRGRVRVGASPSTDSGPPIMTRSGESWSVIALPSRANSGLDSMTTW